MGVSANGIWRGVYTARGCPHINSYSTAVTIRIRLVSMNDIVAEKKPRNDNILTIAIANDGLLPSIFGEVDESGNSKKGALIAGEPNHVKWWPISSH